MTRSTVLIGLGFTLTGIVTTMLGPLLPTLTRLWQLDDAGAGCLFVFQFCFSVLGALLSSRLMMKIASRGAIIAGLAFMTAGVGMLAAGSWTAVILGICCYGLGLGLNIPSTNLLIAGMFPERRASALNLVNFCWSAGAVLAPPLFSFFLQRFSFMAVLGGLSGVLATMSLCLAITTKPERNPDNSGLTDEHLEQLAAPSGAVVLMLSVLLILYVGTETAVGGWMATYAQRMGSSSLSQASLAQAAFWAALLMGRAVAPLVLRRLNNREFVLLSLTSALAGILLVLVSSSQAMITSASLLSGIGLAGVFPTVVAVLTDIFGSSSERRVGPLFAAFGLGGGVLPGLVGLVSRQFQDLRAGMAVCALAITAMLALALVSLPSGVKIQPAEAAPE